MQTTLIERLRIKPMNTFEHIARNYAMTQPVVSCNHTLEDDVRPLERRANTHTRIVRESLNKYGINDRCYKGETPSNNQLTWTRNKGGEFITVKLMYDDSIFVNRHLPAGVSLYADGKGNRILRFISANNVQEALVPHYNYSGGRRYENAVVRADNTLGYKKVKNTGVTLKRHERNPDYVPSGLYDTSNHYWELVSKPYLKQVTRTLVDKAAKAAIKPTTDAFYKWFTIMAPLINGAHRGFYVEEYQALLRSGYSMAEIMADEDNPYRVAVAQVILRKGIVADTSRKEVRAIFNTWVNENTNVTYEKETYEEL